MSIATSPRVLQSAAERSGGLCECRLSGCAHDERCTAAVPTSAGAIARHLFYTRATDDLHDPLNWLVLCPDCFATWQAAFAQYAPAEMLAQ